MKMVLHIDGKAVTFENVARKAQEISFELGGKRWHFRSYRLPGGGHVLEQEMAGDVWQRLEGLAWQGKLARIVQLGGMEASVSEQAQTSSDAGVAGALSPRAPMPGQIVSVEVKPGERVEKGQPLVVMEAMKLQTTLSAGGNATVERVLVKAGDKVNEGAELVVLNTSVKIS